MAIIFESTPFTGGSNDVIPDKQAMVNYLAKSVHQLQFRSAKSIDKYIIRETLGLLIFPNDTVPFTVTPNGYYHKDCYLVHTSNVEINILTVPPVSEWEITVDKLPLKSNEPPQPLGYGQTASGLNAVRQIVFDNALQTQQYFPLTNKRDDLNLIPGQYREQFKVDANEKNKLNPPVPQGEDTLVVGKNYPIVNVAYVQVDMNYNKFVKGT